MINWKKLARELSAFSHCLKDLVIVYYMTVVAFQNKVPMYFGERSLTYYQEYRVSLGKDLTAVHTLCRILNLLVSDCQQFCKGSSHIPKGFF